MEFKTEMHESTAVMTIREPKLTVSNSNHLRDAMEAEVHKGNYKILLDLANVKFMDSSAIGVIFSVRGEMEERANENEEEWNLSLCGLNDTLQNLVNMLKLDTFCNVYPDREAALKS